MASDEKADLVLTSSSEQEESSTSEEEDENGKEWTDEIEKTFLKTLSSLKSKDPKIYDGNIKFFDDNPVEVPEAPNKRPKKEEPMYLRDYERKIILEKGGILTDEESGEEETNVIAEERTKSPTYVEEQRTLKENFKAFLSTDNESASDGECAGFLKVKVKDAREKAKEEEEYIEWLKGQKVELNDKEAEEQLKYLRDYWTNPELNEGEQFLRDYILNKRYIEKDQNEAPESEVSFSEEEKILEECDEYEHKYNFRFEEPDQEFIKTYPRVIENSLRRKDEKRKRKREERKKRKEEQLENKRLELKQLKKQKKQELLEKIMKLKELTGNKELAFNEEDLQKDFSADEYDQKMNQLFNEEFYEKDDDDEKPQFSDLDSDEEKYLENDEEVSDNDPEMDCVTENIETENHGLEESIVAEENDFENEDFIMDCDYNPDAARESKFKKQTRSSRRKGHKKSTFMQVVKKEKPVFNPKDKNFQQYVDEYYGLEFEDIIGDMPCRFKYKKVMPNNFGLTVEEILVADDKELNRWCSMQKVDTIRPEQNEKFDKKIYARRAQNIDLKKKYLPSLFANEEMVENESTSTSENNIKKKKKKRGKKNDSSSKTNIQSVSNKVSADRNHTIQKRKADDGVQNLGSKRMKYEKQKEFSCTTKNNKNVNKKNQSHSLSKTGKKNNVSHTELSDERLKAYGLNPKKFKNKLKYGSNN